MEIEEKIILIKFFIFMGYEPESIKGLIMKATAVDTETVLILGAPWLGLDADKINSAYSKFLEEELDKL